MAVQFILGRSGTGKTSYCIRAILDALLEPGNNQPLILLVPEQATYQAERAILADRRIGGYNNLSVLSFDRLQFWLLGKNTARPALSRVGQQMIIQRILRDNTDKLRIFGPSANWPGLGRQMAGTIIELHQYAKTPDDIQLLLDNLGKDERNSLAVSKFADIGLILQEYLKFIEGRFIDPDIQLSRACRAVPRVSFARDARLWVDGFAGFTAGELAMLAELLKVVAQAQIALCLDASDVDLAGQGIESCERNGLFSPTQRTYAALLEVVKKAKLPLREPIMLNRQIRFANCPELAYLEANMFADSDVVKGRHNAGRRSEAPKIPPVGNIRIVSAPNPRAEVKFVARCIQQLVKEKNYRYRDIAVIASDIDHYEHYIRAYFDDYGVPFFIDKPKPLSQHSAIQLIHSALRVVTGGFSNSDIFAYLRTDLVPIARCDVDLLENYCIAFGIAGSDWISQQPWQFADKDSGQFDQQHVEQTRRQVIEPLLKLRQELCCDDASAGKVSPETFTRAIFDFLDALDVKKTLARWIEEAAEQKDYAAVDEHRQLYDKLVSVFDELVEVFAGQAMSPQDYLAIINSAFSQLTLAFIPPNLDQVLVGSIERSRHPDLKAAFLIGATQKQFPVPISFDSILTDDDRGAAESADFLLSPATRQALTDRQYLAYIAFTRPSEFLCVTYPALDDKASAVPRSPFLADLESVFDNLKEESIAGREIEIEKVQNQTELEDLLCRSLGKDAAVLEGDNGGRLYTLLDDVCLDRQFAQLGERVISAINYRNRAQLDRDVLEEFFGRRISTSATKLSDFAKCPYKHFAEHVLELRERKEFKFEPLDVGVFYHRALDALLKRLNADGKDLALIQDKELLTFVRGEIAGLIQTDAFVSNFARRSAHNGFIIHCAGEYLEDCVLAVAEMVRAGIFRPSLSEVSFGEDSAILGRWELTLAKGQLLSLNGKIDRLDIADVGGRKTALIFDYKRKEESFDWSEFYHGLDMQLPIYMLAVRNARRSKIKNVAGAFYMPVEAKPTKAALDERDKKKEKFDRKARGIFDGEFFRHLDATVGSGWSRFYNFFVSKENGQYGRNTDSGALKPGDFDKLLQFTEVRILKSAEGILSGKVDVNPYYLNKTSPCSYCRYKPLCRFDWQINDYNFLPSLNKVQVLDKIGTVDG
jgi:ATP-dependent helicase/nuclease subunit B